MLECQSPVITVLIFRGNGEYLPFTIPPFSHNPTYREITAALTTLLQREGDLIKWNARGHYPLTNSQHAYTEVGRLVFYPKPVSAPRTCIAR